MNSITKQFEVLRENYNAANAIRYSEFLDECSKSEVLESFTNVFIEPLKGGEFTKKFILTNSFTPNELKMMRESLETFILNAEDGFYSNDSHIESIKESLTIIDAKMESFEHIELVDILLESIYFSDMEITCESAEISNVALQKIISKDIDNATKEKYANKLIQQLKRDNNIINTVRGCNLLIGVTSIIVYYSVTLPISITLLLAGVPLILLAHFNYKTITKTKATAFKGLINSEIKKVEAAINSGNNNNNEAIQQYYQNLLKAKDVIIESESVSLESSLFYMDDIESNAEKIKYLDTLVTENFIRFAFSENESIEESANYLENVIKLSNVKEAIVQEAMIDPDEEEYDDDFEEDIDGMLDFFDEVEEFLDDDLIDPDEYDINTEYSILTEGTKSDKNRKKANVRANKIKSIAHKVKGKFKKASQAGRATAHQIDKAGKALDDAATNAVNKAKGTYRNDIREDIVSNKTRVKFSRIIRKGIGATALIALNPILGAIAGLTTYALSKKVKDKERRLVIHELEEELEIVNEKIEDARGDSDKEKKYQLMRIRNQLQKDIKRIQYRIKSDGRGV